MVTYLPFIAVSHFDSVSEPMTSQWFTTFDFKPLISYSWVCKSAVFLLNSSGIISACLQAVGQIQVCSMCFLIVISQLLFGVCFSPGGSQDPREQAELQIHSRLPFVSRHTLPWSKQLTWSRSPPMQQMFRRGELYSTHSIVLQGQLEKKKKN